MARRRRRVGRSKRNTLKKLLWRLVSKRRGVDPDWLPTLNQKFATSAPSESSNPDSQQEADVCQKITQSSQKSLKGTKNGGIKKAEYGNKKQIERWDFFDPTAEFTNGIRCKFKVDSASKMTIPMHSYTRALFLYCFQTQKFA